MVGERLEGGAGGIGILILEDIILSLLLFEPICVNLNKNFISWRHDAL